MERITTVDQAWEYLIDYSIATEEELQLVTSSTMMGYSFETLESVVYVRTGYTSFDQLMDLDDEDSEEDNDE